MSINDIPQELVNDIVGRIDDTESLRWCSNVASRFVEPSQRRLFRSLQLYTNVVGPRNLTAQNVFLAISPHIASYTMDLTFYIPYSEHEQRVLVSILRALPSLARLGRGGSWTELVGELKDALRAVISRPAVHRLHIIALNYIPPALIVQAISSVSTLLIHIDMEVTADVPAQLPNSPLRFLIIPASAQRVVPLCDVLLRTPAYLTNLERLRIGIHAAGSTYDMRLLSAVALTLPHLELSPQGTAPLLDSVDLPLMPHVQTLTLHLLIQRDYPFPARFPSAALAKMARAFPRIEALILNVHAAVQPHEHDAAWPSREPPVHDDAHFAHLRRVACKLYPERATGDADVVIQKFRIAMEELMPVLRRTPGILSCDFTGRYDDMQSF